MPAPAHIQADTLDKFLTAWKNQAPNDTIALWSDDFKQRVLPQSLGLPSQTRDEAKTLYPKLMGTLTNWKLDIKNIVHDSTKSTAAVYATSYADTPLPDEKWTTDYAIFVSFTEDGTKINALDEMVDSAFYQNYFPKIKQWFMEKAKEANKA